jgi:hypothetical protein
MNSTNDNTPANETTLVLDVTAPKGAKRSRKGSEPAAAATEPKPRAFRKSRALAVDVESGTRTTEQLAPEALMVETENGPRTAHPAAEVPQHFASSVPATEAPPAAEEPAGEPAGVQETVVAEPEEAPAVKAKKYETSLAYVASRPGHAAEVCENTATVSLAKWTHPKASEARVLILQAAKLLREAGVLLTSLSPEEQGAQAGGRGGFAKIHARPELVAGAVVQIKEDRRKNYPKGMVPGFAADVKFILVSVSGSWAMVKLAGGTVLPLKRADVEVC